MTMDNTQEKFNNDLEMIETALAQVKQRKTSEKKTKPSAEEREARKAQILADRETRRAAREAAKANKPSKPKAHLAKVEKAQAALPTLSAAATEVFNESSTNLSHNDILALARHLDHFVRVQRTLNATSATRELTPGMAVRIVSGDPRFVGLEGTINKSQRIRCYVDVPGRSKPVYLFTSDVEIIS